MRRFRPILGVTLLVAVGLSVFAWTTEVKSDDPVIHEFVPNAQQDELNGIVSADGDTPAAIVYDGELLSAPKLDHQVHAYEKPMRAFPGDGRGQEKPGRRSEMFRPDRITALEGTLGYYSVFTPTITPFKRVTALNAVKVDPSGVPILVLSESTSASRTILDVGSDIEDGIPRDRFWGNVVLDFRNGSQVPFPSVAPGSRMLSLRSEPSVPVRIEKDAADNFYAIIEDGSSRMVRVVFLTDAPQRYFGFPVPDVPANTLAEDVQPLPTSVARTARVLLSELSLKPESSLPDALATLTRHFRSFEESAAPPPNTGNILADLTRGMKGICRHRTYAFTILAQALGIPTRFVQNEAHSWVEVSVPDADGSSAFLRIDLGGAADGLDSHSGGDRPSYHPRFADPLPRPEAYRRSYSQAARNNAASNPQAVDPNVQAQPPNENASPDEQLPEPVSQSAPQSRRALVVTTTRSNYEVFRGRALEVSGRASSKEDGATVDGLRIEVLLQSGTGRRRAEHLLGVTVTDAHGHFTGRFSVPSESLVGEHRLVVRSPGDARHEAATTEAFAQ